MFFRFFFCCCCERELLYSLIVWLKGCRKHFEAIRSDDGLFINSQAEETKQNKKKLEQRAQSNLYDLVFWWYHYLPFVDFIASAAIAGQHGRRFEPARSCRNDSLQVDQSDRIESSASPAAHGSIEGTVRTWPSAHTTIRLNRPLTLLRSFNIIRDSDR